VEWGARQELGLASSAWIVQLCVAESACRADLLKGTRTCNEAVECKDSHSLANQVKAPGSCHQQGLVSPWQVLEHVVWSAGHGSTPVRPEVAV
jgi:hypothetical protein